MQRRRPDETSGFGWELVEPSATDIAVVTPLRQVMDLVLHGWTSSTVVDVEDPVTSQMLTRHRLWSLVPTNRVPSEQAESHRGRLAAIFGGQMRVESVAFEVLEALNEAGIESRVLKGLASAELDYPSRSLRQTGDVDLALRPEQFHDAVHLLQRRGFTTHHTVNSPFLLKGTTLDAANGVEVDLHTRLFQRSREGSYLFDNPGERLHDLPSSGLRAEHRLVHAAGHFILAPPGNRRLSGLLDVTRIMGSRSLDLDIAREFAATCRVEAIVGAALRLEAHLAGRVGCPHREELQEWEMPGWLDRKTRVTSERRLALDHLNRFREVPRRDWLRYLPTWLWPDSRQRALLKASAKRKTASLSSGGERAG